MKTESHQPLVSIVTPSYNQVNFLEETIRSVLEQDYSNIEYIIMDGGSSDGSLELLRKYDHALSYWSSSPDHGQTDAINKGFSIAKGDIFAWLNSDDTYEPGAISDAVKFLSTHPDVGMVYGDSNFIDVNGKIIGKFPARQTDLKRLQRGYVHIPQQASFFRAKLWKLVGSLDITTYFAMDYDLWIRLAKISTLKYHQKTWANFRLHESAKTLKADEFCWRDMVHIHFRDGGSWLSIITLKYILRKFIAPAVTWRRRAWVARSRGS